MAVGVGCFAGADRALWCGRNAGAPFCCKNWWPRGSSRPWRATSAPAKRRLKFALVWRALRAFSSRWPNRATAIPLNRPNAAGRDVIIAVDTSRSMLATDVTPDRLGRAKLAAQDSSIPWKATAPG